jgi:hypothetical protein
MKKILLLISILFFVNATNTSALTASHKVKTDDCALIVMKNGDVVSANIIQITPSEIKYKRCGKPNDPEISVAKSDVLSVKTADGDTLYRNKDKAEVKDEERKVNGMAVASLVTGILGIITSFIFIGLVLAVLGVIFGAVALRQIKRNPKRFRGRGMAIAGLVCGIITLAIFSLLVNLAGSI